MVIVNTWEIIDVVFLKASITLYEDTRTIIAMFRISTEEIKINTKVTDLQRIGIKKALIAIYLKYKRRAIKSGEKQIVALG